VTQSLYLAYRYLTFHKVRSLVLVASISIITFLPNGLKRLITESEAQMMARANATPLVVGAKGSSTDLVINTLYFQQEATENISMEMVDALSDTGLGYPIPVFSAFKARGFPIIGTSLDYFDFRGLRLQSGRHLAFLGECVIGAAVAEALDISVGDSLVSSPENFFDLAGVYPLKMTVVGVLTPSGSPDDGAVFTDLGTTWVIMGLGHGHEDLEEVTDRTVLFGRDGNNIQANAKLFLYNQITAENRDAVHFHGERTLYPISAALFVPDDEKAATILRGRFETDELPHQVVLPTQVVTNLLQSVFRIQQIFDTVFVLVGLSTLLILGLIAALSLRIRKDEIHTLFTMGSSRSKIAEVLGFELGMIIGVSLVVVVALYALTGYFVDDFIRAFVI